MDQTVLLSVALLSIALSFHGALANSGCRVSQTGLENYCMATKDEWAQSLQGPLQQLPVLPIPGLLKCRFDILTCETVRVVMRPPYGVDIVVCLVIRLRCYVLLPVTVSVSYCVTISLRVVHLGLSVGSCSAEYVGITLDPVLSIQLPVVAEALSPLLDPLVCGAAPAIALRLNLILGFNLQSSPFFTGCQYICTTPYPPQLTSTYLDFRFVPQMTCGGAVVPWPQYTFYYPPATLIPDGHVCYFWNDDDMGHIFASLVSRQLFNQELMSAVTTTLVMSQIPEIVCPGGLPTLLKFSCTSFSIQFIQNTIIVDAVLSINVGYIQSTYFSILQITARLRIIFRVTNDCRKGLLLFLVDVISDLQITSTCSGIPCSVSSSLIEELFPIRTLCRDLFNERLKGGIPWPFPTNCACSTCHDVIIVPKCAMWCCNLSNLD